MKTLIKAFFAIGFGFLSLAIYSLLGSYEVVPVSGLFNILPFAVVMAYLYYLIFERKKNK